MCGIFVFQGSDAVAQTVQGLKKCEYRGYDSWGVGWLSAGQLKVHKEVGAISEVTEQISSDQTQFAIGHTRWATHGGVTELNAHPHLSPSGRFVVVHNGVIENFSQIKEQLGQQGYQFVTETDTEVLVGLLEQSLIQNQSWAQVLQSAIEKVAGRNSWVVMTDQGEIWAYQGGSSLVVGTGSNQVVVTSDSLSFPSDISQIAQLTTGTLLKISSSGQIDSIAGKLSAWTAPVTNQAELTASTGASSVMVQEIHHQTETWVRVAESLFQVWPQLEPLLTAAEQVWCLGAGSACFAAEFLAYQLRSVGKHVLTVPAYEFGSFVPLITSQTVVIVFSQSGETADTIEAVEALQAAGAKVISVVNRPGSQLTTLADVWCPLNVGPETAVASTKAVTGQLVWSLVVAQLLAKSSDMPAILADLVTSQQQLHAWLQSDHFPELVSLLQSQSSLFVLGKGSLLPIAREWALKLKEIAQLHAEAFAAGELKHGVLALVEPGVSVVVLVPAETDPDYQDVILAAQEVAARGGYIIGVAEQSHQIFADWIEVPGMAWLTPVMQTIPAQLLTLHIAQAKHLNPDRPRNLAKSVTVK